MPNNKNMFLIFQCEVQIIVESRNRKTDSHTQTWSDRPGAQIKAFLGHPGLPAIEFIEKAHLKKNESIGMPFPKPSILVPKM